MTVETVILAMVAAVLYAGTAFIKKVPMDEPEKFNWVKFLATIVLGLAIGIAAATKGIIPDQTSMELQLGLFAGSTAIIENVIKLVLRIIKKYVPLCGGEE